jgi:hypothetical protein
MSQVGNPSLGYGGLHLGAGPNGPVALFFGNANPNSISDPVSTLDKITLLGADIGSLYIQGGVGHWQKTAFPNTWVQVSVP